MSKTFVALASIIGTMIGAGVLAIPYVIEKSGFGLGVLNMVIIGILMCLTMLYLGEITLRTKTNHQLSGYAAKYLGKTGKKIMLVSFAFGIYAAILAYLIAESESLSILFFGTTTHAFALGLVFWAAMSFIVFFGIKALEEGEIIGVSIIFVLIISVITFSWHNINSSNLTYNNLSNIFTPFGVILFAFLGFSIIPEVGRIIGKEKSVMKKSIIFAHIIVFLVYLAFAAVVLGSYGKGTPQIATFALGKPFIFLGMLTMFTSYLALSVALIDSFRFDFKKSKKFSWILTVVIPILLFVILEFFSKANFTLVLGIGGVLSGGLTAILILFMAKRAKEIGDRVPEYSIPYSSILTIILAIVFIAAAILEIINVWK